MRQIRRNVFETNSSSTHSCCICTKDEYKRWSNGELLVHGYGNDEFVTVDQAIASIKADYKYYKGELEDMENMTDEQIETIFADYCFYTYNSWFGDYEGDTTHYTTPGGEEIVAVCLYGSDY